VKNEKVHWKMFVQNFTSFWSFLILLIELAIEGGEENESSY